ncbi:MAG: xanthine dehydrogenase family protein molybdopterin-binding subunit [Rhodospirillaceae bacterium]|nr:xanthine dehydrogenase family protein molybdopterin-binding subunit [Rhodospirillaceae bacterium]
MTFSRRTFLAQAGSLSILVSFGAVAQTPPAPVQNPSAWVTVGVDNIIRIVSPASEMGQGSRTALALILAEDLDADWANVRIIDAPVIPKIYGNAALFDTMRTVGSRTVQGYYQQLRIIGAQMRHILLMAAAARWNVPVAELSTEPSVVVHAKSGKRLSYGALARSLKVPGTLPVITPADLKPLSDCRYIGHDVQRVDVPSKTDGSAQYGIDVQLPDMLHAVVLRAPVEGEKPVSIDDADARAIKGVRKIVELPYGVGIIADNHWAAQKAKLALRVTWSDAAKARAYDSTGVSAAYTEVARDKAAVHIKMVDKGDALAANASAAKVLTAEFTSDHVAHSCMEPLNATIIHHGDHAEAWLSNQSPQIMQYLCANALGLALDKVTIHSTLLGGGFGRRTDGPEIIDAALLAKEMPGRPVKVLWDREDDIRADAFRPLSAQRVEIGLDANNNITGWWHRLVCASVYARIEPETFERYKGRDPVSAGGGTFPYAVPAQSVEWVRDERGKSVGAWRGVAASYMKLPIETLMDEIAGLRGADPVEYRLSLLDKEPRAAAVIRAVAEMADWAKPRKGRALGFAYSDALSSHVAMVTEVSLDQKSGKIKVHHIWAVIDAGVAVQPGNIVAQMEGSILFGLGAALHEQINIHKGEVREANFDSYRVTQMADVPAIDVKIIPTAFPPSGVGEAGVAPVAPAIANAVARLTGGRRLRHLPFTPERARGALA